MKILVIDDEGMIRTLAEKILVRAGHTVFLAESGSRGIDLFREHSGRIDLLIVDMTMEGLSGEETLRACRTINPSISAVFSSGHALEVTDIPVDLQPNTCYLQKPYRASELFDKVDRALVVSATVEYPRRPCRPQN